MSKQVHIRFPPHIAARARRKADRLGITLSALVIQSVARDTEDEWGRPSDRDIANVRIKCAVRCAGGVGLGIGYTPPFPTEELDTAATRACLKKWREITSELHIESMAAKVMASRDDSATPWRSLSGAAAGMMAWDIGRGVMVRSTSGMAFVPDVHLADINDDLGHTVGRELQAGADHSPLPPLVPYMPDEPGRSDAGSLVWLLDTRTAMDPDHESWGGDLCVLISSYTGLTPERVAAAPDNPRIHKAVQLLSCRPYISFTAAGAAGTGWGWGNLVPEGADRQLPGYLIECKIEYRMSPGIMRKWIDATIDECMDMEPTTKIRPPHLDKFLELGGELHITMPETAPESRPAIDPMAARAWLREMAGR